MESFRRFFLALLRPMKNHELRKDALRKFIDMVAGLDPDRVTLQAETDEWIRGFDVKVAERAKAPTVTFQAGGYRKRANFGC